MEALVIRARCALLLASSASFLFLPQFANAASHRTENFIVTARTKELASTIAITAERYRKQLAVEWLGHELPRWSQPCPIKATKIGPRYGAGGATSFLFQTQGRQFARPASYRSGQKSGDGLFQARPVGRPYGWEMSVEGSRERVLDSVLPHEVTHTIFATHFGRPLPRWADEGASTTVEHISEKAKQHRMLYQFLKNDRGIAFNRMFAMNEYPADILPLYSQGFSLARFLIAQGGKRKFVKYIEDGLNSNNWTQSTKSHYGFGSLSELQVTWNDWVREGSPALPKADAKPTMLASLDRKQARNQASARSQVRDNQIRPMTKSASTWKASGKAATQTATGESWYVNRSRATAREEGEGHPTASSSSFTQRVASRPEAELRPREVLLEWGRPTTFLTPQLSPKTEAPKTLSPKNKVPNVASAPPNSAHY